MATIRIVSPETGARVSGSAVELRAAVEGADNVRGVWFEIGYAPRGTKEAADLGDGSYGFTWDTLHSFKDGSYRYLDSCYWIRARAVADDAEITSDYIQVFTANNPMEVPDHGWRPELEWHASYWFYSWWRNMQSSVIGESYASLEPDPTGARRNAIRVSIPDEARHDWDQPGNTTVRFQSAARRNIVEGDEFCVGFAIYPPDDFPTTYGHDDPTNPDPDGRATGWINIFQFYGAPFDSVAPIILQTNRRHYSDPLDEFSIARNHANEGEPTEIFQVPYNRNAWTDIVFRIKVSRSIEHGWIETYVNQGAHSSVQPVSYINGLTRVPRVTLPPNPGKYRTDMQIYRVAGRIPNVTLWHTAHRVGPTVDSVDPRSYA